MAIQQNEYKVSETDVFVGAALHDIGYIRINGIRHGIVGGEIALELGYSKRIARIIETHIVGGISKELIIASNLDLPIQDFLPIALEEKIVACADQLVHERCKSGIYLIEDPSKNEEIAMNIYKLYEDIFYLCFNSRKETVHNSK
ncbi:MAG: HD domain-containing protein [ANME-2 cluster archaeon]|nr:HD domain-containing protein [ANME-2 cluster archaeon]